LFVPSSTMKKGGFVEMPSLPRRRSPRLPLLVAAIFRALVPTAEREEVLEDLRAEFARRVDEHGVAAARRWLWREALGSLPPLVWWEWWRMTVRLRRRLRRDLAEVQRRRDFDPHANRRGPGGPYHKLA